MYEYQDVYYVDKHCITALKLAENHGKKITFHKNCKHIQSTFCSDSLNILDIEEVVLPKDLRTVDKNTFANCKNLKSVEFNKSLREIGLNAFDNTGLTSITIPASVNQLWSNAFNYCKDLKQITFEEPSEIKVIPKNCFRECSNLENINLPDSIEQIRDGAFSGCSSLKKIHIGKNVKIISPEAFLWCDNIEEIDIDSENKNYDNRDNCNAIIATVLNNLIFGNKHTTIPDSVVIIGEDAFKNSNIEHITLPSSVKYIKPCAFAYSLIKEITLPKNLREIGDFAFAQSNLESINLPDNVSVGDQAFYRCTALKNVKWSGKADTVNSGTFDGCTSLEKITNIEHVKNISENAFSNCYQLNNVVLGKNIELIDERAFYCCVNLSSITLPYNPRLNIHGTAFRNSFIENEALNSKKYFEIASILLEIIPAETLKIEEGIKKISAFLIDEENKAVVKSITFPSTLLEIEPHAFQNLESLEHIQLNEGLEIIGRDAFCNTALHELTLPSTLKLIGSGAFRNCTSLRKVAPFNFDNYVAIGNSVFNKTAISDISFFKSCVIPPYTFCQCPFLKEARIHPQVKKIRGNAFNNSSVERIILHQDLKQIDFLGDLPSIEEIIFHGSLNYLDSISDPENIKMYRSKLRTIDNLEELIDSNVSLKEINKIYKILEKNNKGAR